jgi:hypothetical protein
MYVKNFFPQYKGEIGIGDGVRGINTTADTIICREKNGDRQILKIGTHCGKRAITEWKNIKSGKVAEWMRFGAFWRWMTAQGRAVVRYHKKSVHRMHGIAERPDQKFLGETGTCKTQYSWGKFMHQDFWYPGGHRRAYSFHHTDKTVKFRYPNGKIAAEISCPGGFRIYGSDGLGCFRPSEDGGSSDKFDFSRDGNCALTFYDRRGRIKHRGEFRNRQRHGEWVLNGSPVYFVHGVAIAKKLWDTPSEKLNIKKVIRLKNAQMRAALLAKIGPERLVKGLRGKTIDATKNGMKLIELPIKLDEGRGMKNQHMRILQVTCPSTKTKYYLNVPDYIAKDGEKRIKLDKCEPARQWTMLNDNPKKRIKFALET